MGISRHDKQALADLITAMGVPLVIALQTVESWSRPYQPVPLPQKAEEFATLLNAVVNYATKITKKLEIRDAYTLESVRGKMIRIVTPIIAEIYIANGKWPEEEALKELTDLFDVLLSFADSITLEEDKSAKPHRIALMIEAFEPVLIAVKDHAFGLPPESIFIKIAGSIQDRSETLAEQLNMDNAVQSGLLKSVSSLYVSCHNAFTAKVEAGKTTLTGDDALQAVWRDCDERMALIQGVIGFVGDDIGVSIKKSTRTADPVQKAKVTPVVTKEIVVESVKDGEGGDEDSDGDFNPMAFFAGGKG